MMGNRRRAMGLVGFALLVALLSVPLAGAGQIEERTAYTEQVEPICKKNVLANKRIFRGAKEEVKKGELKKASKHFFRAATAFAKTILQMEAVPRPIAYRSKLSTWFSLLRNERSLIEKIGRALAHEDKHKASSYSVDLNRNSIRANNTVLGFGFDYCRIEPSRFG
jgi:hypothetical protein